MQAGGDNDPIDVVDLSTVAVQTGVACSTPHTARHEACNACRGVRTRQHAACPRATCPRDAAVSRRHRT